MDRSRLLKDAVLRTATPTQPTTPASQGAAVAAQMARRTASMLPTVTPSVPVPSPTRSFGASFGAGASRAPLPDPDWIISRLQQAGGGTTGTDEPWVEVSNGEDEDDFLYMPQSVAENRPAGWEITGTLTDEQRAYQQQSELSIYNQPYVTRQAFGIAMPIDPKDVAPQDTGLIRSPQPFLPTLTPHTPLPPPVTPGTPLPNQQPQVDPTSGLPPMGASPVDPANPPSALERAGGVVPGILPRLITESRQQPDDGFSWTDPGDWLSAINEGARGAGAFITNYGEGVKSTGEDIINADPGSWAITEGNPFLLAVLDLLDENNDGGEDLDDKIRGSFGDFVEVLRSGSEAALPETFEDVPGQFLDIVNMPSEQFRDWRVEALHKHLNGEDLSWTEQRYIDWVTTWENVSDNAIEPIPGIGWTVEKAENLSWLDIGEWAIENPDAFNAAYAEGGPEAVWEAYQEMTTGEGIGGMLLRLSRDVSNDPLTYLPIAGAFGKGVTRVGRGARMAPEAGPLKVGVGTTVEQVGRAITGGSRIAEGIADLGAEYLLKGGAKVLRRSGETAPTEAAQAAADVERWLDAARQIEQTQVRQGDLPDPELPGDAPVQPGVAAPVPVDAGDVVRAAEDDALPAEQPVQPEVVDPEVAQRRIDTAQSQPEPPASGPGAIRDGQGIGYTPGITLRRRVTQVEGEPPQSTWAVEVSTDGGRTLDDTIESGTFRQALEDAEQARIERTGEPASAISVVPTRWLPDMIEGQRAIDDIARQMDDTSFERLTREMEDEWAESVERQAEIGDMKSPMVDHAIETSRITARTVDAARGELDPGWKPTFEAGRDPDTAGTPYHAAEDVIHQPWGQTADQRAFLYGNASPKWEAVRRDKNGKAMEVRPAEKVVRAIPQNFSKMKSWNRRALLEQAARYVDLVEEHRRWFPNESGEAWERALRQAQAIRDNPHFQRWQASKGTNLISEGGLRGDRKTRRMIREEEAGRETERQRARDAEVDPRYPSEVMADNTIRYDLGDGHVAYITPERRSDIPAAEREAYKDHPDYRNSRWFTGHVERDGENVTGATSHPNQAELLDLLTEQAGVARRTESGAGEAARAVDADTGEITDATTTPDAADAARTTDAPEPEPDEPRPAGTEDVSETVTEPPDTSELPTPREKAPEQVRHAPAALARAEGTAATRRKVQRSTDFTGTTNEGFLFGTARSGGIPMSPELETYLTSFRFANGVTLKERLEQLKRGYMNGKSRMREKDAEAAAIKKASEEVHERIAELYPGASVPNPVRKLDQAWAGMTEFARGSILAGPDRLIAYPAMQGVGNTYQLAMALKPHWIPRMWLKDLRAGRRQILAPVWKSRDEARLADIQKKIDTYEKRANKGGGLSARLHRQNIERRRKIQERLAAQGDPEPWRHDPGISDFANLMTNLGTGTGREIADFYTSAQTNIHQPYIAERLFRKVGTKDWNLGFAGKLFGDKRIIRIGSYFDAALRHTVGFMTARAKLRELTPDFRNYVTERVTQWGWDEAKANRVWQEFWDETVRPDGTFNADMLYRHYREAGLSEGRAMRLHRDWQSRVNKLQKDTQSEIRRISFAGDETRADEVLKRTLIFHYFFSRQAYFFATQMARHPFLINAYIDMQDQLAAYAEDHDGIIPDSWKGWVAIMGTPLGFNVFANLVNPFTTYITNFGMDTDFEVDKITGFGSFLNEVNDLVGLNPWFNVIPNMLGYMGDDFAPDPLFLWSETSKATAVVNWLRAHGWLGSNPRPVGNAYEDAMSEVREDTSGWSPGSVDIPASSSVQDFNRDIHYIAIDEAEKMGRDPLHNVDDAIWVTQQLADPESELYQRSVKRWTNGEVVEDILQAVLSPFRVRTRQGRTSEDGEDIGIFGTNVHPDLIISANDDNPAVARTIGNTTDPRALEMRGQQMEYDDLGTREQRRANDMYSDIRYGTVLIPIEVNGEVYSPAEIQAMDDEQRQLMATAYLQERGVYDTWSDYRDEQDRWLAENDHREYATYKRWSAAVWDHEGGPLGYFEEQARDDPNARMYLENVLAMNYTDERTNTALASMEGYFAVEGIGWDAFAPDMDAPGEDIAGVADGAPQPTPYEPYVVQYHEDIRNDVAELTEKMQTWDGTTDIYVSDNVKDYLAWKQDQPAGADTSLDAYIAALDAEYKAGAGERFEESLRPKLSDDEAMQMVSDLYTQYGDDNWINVEDGNFDGGSGSGSGNSGMGSFDWLFG